MTGTQPNWQRGMLRLWLVATAVWIVAMSWYQYGHTPKPESKGLTIALSEDGGFKVDTGEEEVITSDICDEYFDDDGRPRKLMAMVKYPDKEACLADINAKHSARLAAQTHKLSLIFLPPLLLLLLFPLGKWLMRGFKS
jgi:hypothetical protein